MKSLSVTTGLLFLIRILAVMSVANIILASPNIEQGDTAFANRNITKAIQQYQIELKNNSDSVIARTKLARCYMRKGYKSATLKMVDEAITLNPNDVDVLILKSKLHIWNSKYDDAMGILNQVLVLSPNNIEAYRDLAGIYNEKGETKAADELYLKINTLNANN
jgi:Flp pilus assembly protein TadD